MAAEDLQTWMANSERRVGTRQSGTASGLGERAVEHTSAGSKQQCMPAPAGSHLNNEAAGVGQLDLQAE